LQWNADKILLDMSDEVMAFGFGQNKLHSWRTVISPLKFSFPQSSYKLLFSYTL